MTSQQRWARQSWAMFALVIVLAVVAGVALVALVQARDARAGQKRAVERAQSVADCVNNVLATRQQTTTNDAIAELNFISSLNAVFLLPPGDAQNAAFVNFEAVARATAKTLTDDQAYRTAHPLGTC